MKFPPSIKHFQSQDPQSKCLLPKKSSPTWKLFLFMIANVYGCFFNI